ncbi:hypothetical protein H2248_005449 [Termitomyces sp. 'cryptogamus']|nr:hypothetical protein H2248_005449 [Termitomyces sp. 'cryptogamus']
MGVDAIALNYGASSWELDQIASAYAAAKSISSPLKLFLSPDFTSHACDLDPLIAEIKRFAGHPSQFKVNGRVMVSSFEGKCLKQVGWQKIKSEVGAYLMPFISGLEGQFGQWGVLDTWFCWGCAWPSGNIDKTMADDHYYISQLGSRYGTTVSPWLFTHYDYKNFLHKSDDWLYLTRWNQLMAMRDQLTFVEVISWNDFGESHYMGPIHGLQPSGTTWVNNFPHTAWQELSAYYIHAFKTGSYPTITEDIVYYWARPHPASARASKDSLEKPQGWDWVSDTLWAAVFLTAPGTVTLTSGSSSQTFKNVPAGVSRLSIPLTPGMISVKVERGGKTVASERARGYNYVSTPETYNFNAWVGAAKGTVQPSSTPTSIGTLTTTSTTTTTSLSMTTSKSVHATTTSTATTTSSTSQATHTPPTSKWSSLGCFVDTSYPRILPVFGASSSSMTPQACTSMCASHGYSYAATEYGVECWCGSGIDLSTSVSKEQCNIPCAGDKTRTCGAAWRAEVYFRSGS